MYDFIDYIYNFWNGVFTQLNTYTELNATFTAYGIYNDLITILVIFTTGLVITITYKAFLYLYKVATIWKS